MSQLETEKVELTIDGNSYPINVTRAEKQISSTVEVDVNKRIKSFRSQFQHLSKEESLTMILISMAFENEKSKAEISDFDQYIEEIEKLVSI